MERGDESSLDQRVLRCAPGERIQRTTDAGEDVLYILRGTCAVLAGDERHAAGPDSGVCVAPGERYELANEGDEEVELVAVRVPDPPAGGGRPRCRVVRLADQSAGAATADREFRLLCHPGSGCHGATQFVGSIPPGRAPDHFHLYDEVIYVLRGEGVMHLPWGDTPAGPGTCLHLAPRTVHSFENVGDSALEVLGVFRPAGSPAEAYYPDGTPATTHGRGENAR